MWLRMWLAAVASLIAGACTSPLGPELPESVTFEGLTLTASAEVVDGRSSLRVEVIVSNETSETQGAETGSGRDNVLVRLYRRSESPVFDEADTIGGFQGGAVEITLAPGDRLVLSSEIVDVREALGAEFERGRYLVTATTSLWVFRQDTRVKEEFELRAGTVDLE